MRSPDAREQADQAKESTGSSQRRVKDKTRKRKRAKYSALSQEDAERAGSRQRTESSDEGLALRVNYGNGQSEEIRIQSQRSSSPEEVSQDTDHFRIARYVTFLYEVRRNRDTIGSSVLWKHYPKGP
jgi:nuclear receptor interaction protein